MADITKNDLVHAGLPWTNPEKITVKSDEYISQLVINRGLLSLLSNDYYLDLKSQRINQYIEDIINQHMGDGTIHFTKDQIGEIVKRILTGDDPSGDSGGGDDDSLLYTGLKRDTTYILPLYRDENSIQRIKNIINKCPKNLNGKTLIFAFSLPKSQFPSLGSATSILEYVRQGKNLLNLSNVANFNINGDCFSFDSFYGGTLIVIGNDMFLINDLNNQGNVNYDVYDRAISPTYTRILLEQIQQRLITDTNQNKKITLEGTGLNTSFSVLSFRNCAADCYLWNLGLNNKKTPTDIYVDPTDTDLPLYYDLTLFYPFIKKYTTANVAKVYDYNPETFETVTLKSTLNLNTSQDSLLNSSLSGIQFTNLNDNYLYYDDIDLQDTTPTVKTISNKIKRSLYGKYVDSTGSLVKDELYNGCTIVFWMNQNFKRNNYDKVPILYDYDEVNGNGIYIGLDGVYVWEDGQISERYQTDYLGKLKGNDKADNHTLFYIIKLSGYTEGNNNRLQIKMSFVGKKYPLESTCSCPDDCTCGCKDKEGTPLICEGSSIITIKNLPINMTSNLKWFGTDQITTNGYIRNLLIFNKNLSSSELKELYNENIPLDFYSWRERTESISGLINDKLYSSLYVYNTNMLNVIGCKLTQNNN